MFKDSFLNGIGWQQFAKSYNLYQAKYFSFSNYTKQEFLLADNTFYAFNDYWQLIVETGLSGCIILLFLSWLLFKIVEWCHTHQPDNQLLKMATIVIIILTSAALFTHVFFHKVYQIIFLLALIYILLMRFGVNIKPKLLLLVMPISVLFIGITLNLGTISKFDAYETFANARELDGIGATKESKLACKSIYPELHNDVDFLKFYSSLLFATSETRASLAVTLQATSVRSDNQLYLQLGKIYEKLGDAEKARSAYLLAITMVPNRFLPRKYLFEFYLRQGEYVKAKGVASKVLSMPVKVPSQTVNEIT
jgi:tetratricopeptide (TPR) repeat protein